MVGELSEKSSLSGPSTGQRDLDYKCRLTPLRRRLHLLGVNMKPQYGKQHDYNTLAKRSQRRAGKRRTSKARRRAEKSAEKSAE
jgi:hypothetical protein